MDQDQKEQKKFLEEQLQWSKEQVLILDEMNIMLLEMKRIAEYVVEHQLTPMEIEQMNSELKVLKEKYKLLEKKYYPVIH